MRSVPGRSSELPSVIGGAPIAPAGRARSRSYRKPRFPKHVLIERTDRDDQHSAACRSNRPYPGSLHAPQETMHPRPRPVEGLGQLVDGRVGGCGCATADS